VGVSVTALPAAELSEAKDPAQAVLHIQPGANRTQCHGLFNARTAKALLQGRALALSKGRAQSQLVSVSRTEHTARHGV